MASIELHEWRRFESRCSKQCAPHRRRRPTPARTKPPSRVSIWMRWGHEVALSGPPILRYFVRFQLLPRRPAVNGSVSSGVVDRPPSAGRECSYRDRSSRWWLHFGAHPVRAVTQDWPRNHPWQAVAARPGGCTSGGTPGEAPTHNTPEIASDVMTSTSSVEPGGFEPPTSCSHLSAEGFQWVRIRSENRR